MDECHKVVQYLGYNPTLELTKKRFQDSDIDHSGTMDFFEFCEAMIHSWDKNSSIDQTLMQEFIVYDPNKNAQIRFKNIEEAFGKLKLAKLELHELEELVGEDFWNEKANGVLVERRVV